MGIKILQNGTPIRATSYNLSGEANVVGAAVASVTFSGLSSQPRIAIDIDWKHAGLGIERLDLQLEGGAAPAGSTMVRSQLASVVAGTISRQDRVDPGFTVTDLVGIVASTAARAVVYALCDPTVHEDITYVEAEGYAKDGAVLVTDTETWHARSGRWNQLITGFTTASLVVGSGGSKIAVGSFVRFFNAGY